ncbi:hypothetical protein BC829DRAFT_62170 [Chytridium lagenaria]|nr:hypothetical protein BC829DRAFT_62170 [Chytridium lagenaria]
MTDGTRDTSEKLSASTQSESSTACVAMTGVPFPPTSVKPVASTPSVFERLATAKKKVPIVIAERNPVNGVSSRPTSASVAAAIGASPAPRPPSAGPTTMNGSGRTINGKSSTASLTENQRPVAIGSLQRKVAAGVPVGPMLPLKSSSTSLNPAASGTKINETEPTDSTSTLFVERTSVTLSPTMAAGSSSPLALPLFLHHRLPPILTPSQRSHKPPPFLIPHLLPHLHKLLRQNAPFHPLP